MRVVAALIEKNTDEAQWREPVGRCLPNGAMVVPIITTRNKEEHSMMDVIVLGLAFGFFAHAIGYAHVCERLWGEWS